MRPGSIAVLLFDKRGTGSSGGDFGMDFSQLEDKVDWLRRQTDPS